MQIQKHICEGILRDVLRESSKAEKVEIFYMYFWRAIILKSA